MPWARASSLQRHLECPASSHFPRLDRGRWAPGYLQPDLDFNAITSAIEVQDTSAADWGVSMHAAKAGAPEAQDPWLTWVDPHRERLWPGRLGRHEVSVSYDCRLKDILTFCSESESERNAWKDSQGPDCVVGTCDWWGQLPSGEPWIDDLKTGWAKPDVVTPQTLFYLLCRVLLSDWDTGRISITHWPRAKAPTEPSRDGLWRQVSRVALEAFELEITEAWRRAHNGAEPRPGAHCIYCPSSLVCPRSNG